MRSRQLVKGIGGSAISVAGCEGGGLALVHARCHTGQAGAKETNSWQKCQVAGACHIVSFAPRQHPPGLHSAQFGLSE